MVPIFGCGALARRKAQRAPWNPKDAGSRVLVGILGIGALRLLSFQFGVLRLECVGNVFEKNQAEDDVLVLRRVHVIAQRVRHAPELSFINSSKRTVCQSVHLRFIQIGYEALVAKQSWALGEGTESIPHFHAGGTRQVRPVPRQNKSSPYHRHSRIFGVELRPRIRKKDWRTNGWDDSDKRPVVRLVELYREYRNYYHAGYMPQAQISYGLWCGGEWGCCADWWARFQCTFGVPPQTWKGEVAACFSSQPSAVSTC